MSERACGNGANMHGAPLRGVREVEFIALGHWLIVESEDKKFGMTPSFCFR